MVNKYPKCGYSLSKWPKWLVNGGDPNHLQILDDPPSNGSYGKHFVQCMALELEETFNVPTNHTSNHRWLAKYANSRGSWMEHSQIQSFLLDVHEILVV